LERRKTMRIMKLLTLAAVAVVAVACDGISPTSPNATVSSDDATTFVATKALKGSDDSGCRDITQVQMRVLPTLGDIEVEAIYLKDGVPASCALAPSWSSRPRGRIVPTRDPFVVKVRRTWVPMPVTVTAQAPNGVRGSIRVPQG
jgi:hypothetical protein